jgi:hypothetical protein
MGARPNFMQTFPRLGCLYSKGGIFMGTACSPTRPPPRVQPARMLRPDVHRSPPPRPPRTLVHAPPGWCRLRRLHQGGNTTQDPAISQLTNDAPTAHGASVLVRTLRSSLGASVPSCLPRRRGAATPSMVQVAPWVQRLQPTANTRLAHHRSGPMVQLSQLHHRRRPFRAQTHFARIAPQFGIRHSAFDISPSRSPLDFSPLPRHTP